MDRVPYHRLGVRVGRTAIAPGVPPAARLLRTHPPAPLAASGVAALEFAGAMPFTRLTPTDPSLAPSLGLQLYGRSRWLVGDRDASAVPWRTRGRTRHS